MSKGGNIMGFSFSKIFNCCGVSRQSVYEPGQRPSDLGLSKLKRHFDVRLQSNALKTDGTLGLKYYDVCYKGQSSRLFFVNSGKHCRNDSFKAAYTDHYERETGQQCPDTSTDTFKQLTRKHGSNATVRPAFITTPDNQIQKMVLCRKTKNDQESLNAYPFNVLEGLSEECKAKRYFIVPIGYVPTEALSEKQTRKEYDHMELFNYGGDALSDIILSFEELSVLFDEMKTARSFIENERIHGLDFCNAGNILFLRSAEPNESKIKFIDLHDVHTDTEVPSYGWERLLLHALSRTISHHYFKQDPDAYTEISDSNPAQTHNQYDMFEKCEALVDNMNSPEQEKILTLYLDYCRGVSQRGDLEFKVNSFIDQLDISTIQLDISAIKAQFTNVQV